jgi:hypothetical protein
VKRPRSFCRNAFDSAVAAKERQGRGLRDESCVATDWEQQGERVEIPTLSIQETTLQIHLSSAAAALCKLKINNYIGWTTIAIDRSLRGGGFPGPTNMKGA